MSMVSTSIRPLHAGFCVMTYEEKPLTHPAPNAPNAHTTLTTLTLAVLITCLATPPLMLVRASSTTGLRNGATRCVGSGQANNSHCRVKHQPRTLRRLSGILSVTVRAPIYMAPGSAGGSSSPGSPTNGRSGSCGLMLSTQSWV
jgi:hypothetical protein